MTGNRYHSRLTWTLTSALASCIVLTGVANSIGYGQEKLDDPPISYSETPTTDAVQQLIGAIRDHEMQLEWDSKFGWLPALLDALDVDKCSQTLVFSKTSLQVHSIHPRNPRALYYNDDVYLGWVPGGDVIELSAVDPVQGAIFYSVKNRRTTDPQIVRDDARCLSCHATNKTQNVPGYLIRSVFAGENGHPHYHLGTVTTDHTTPFEDRFGGWYVTGQHGEMLHRGNVFVDNNPQQPIDWEAGANRETLEDLFDVSAYLLPDSDLVALMVLEHQTQMHNFMTQVSYETRRSLFHQAQMNAIFERPLDTPLDSSQRRIQSSCEKLLKYLLFSAEAPLLGPVQGSPQFIEQFQRSAVRDSSGRSLREFDLNHRMFRYPCSYLIYSESFDALPVQALEYIARRLVEILTATDSNTEFSHLLREDRQAIYEILQETKPDFIKRGLPQN